MIIGCSAKREDSYYYVPTNCNGEDILYGFGMLINNQPKLYERLIKAIRSDFKTRKEEIIKKRFAIYWADEISAPLLLMHGGTDQSVDPMQTLKLAQLLQAFLRKREKVLSQK